MKTNLNPPSATQILKRALLPVFVIIVGVMAILTPNGLAAPIVVRRPSVTQTPIKDSGFGKSHLVQNAQWYAAKLAGKITRPGNHLRPYGGTPSTYTLSDTVTPNTWEPEGYGYDSSNTYYTDNYYWLFRGEGASTNALAYWGQPGNSKGIHQYTDPHTTTTWNDTYNRSYLMYLATQSTPPSFGSPGEFAFGTYSNVNGQTQGTTHTTDLRDTLNWEASGHNSSTWSTYFYAIVWAANLSQSNLFTDIQTDVYNAGVPVVVDVNTAYLLNWAGTGKSLSHYVAIIGYSGSSTYTYIDTCGVHCGSNGHGVYTVTQSQLYNGIENNAGNGSITW
ncbi:MAG: hypothetical protein ACRDHE_10605 [Ktedonobacterales bacterium]